MSISAVPGLRFTFTAAQTDGLQSLSAQIRDNIRRKPVGWRVFVVQNINAMNRIVKEALDDYHGKEADSASP